MQEEDLRKKGIVCALENADTKGVFLELLKTDLSKIIQGIELEAKKEQVEEKILFLPEYASSLANALEEILKAHNIKMEIGLVDDIKYADYSWISIPESIDLAEKEEGVYQSGKYLSINGNPLKKFLNDTNISELLDLKEAKAVLCGYRYEIPQNMEMTIENADVSNGVLSIISNETCILAQTHEMLLDYRKQSCGKCVFCREGLIQLEYMQKEIMEGRGKTEYLEISKEIGEAMRESSNCSVGAFSANLVLSGIEKFGSEYEEHVKKKHCPAGVCYSSSSIYIDPDRCSGCGECVDVCPKDCIDGKINYIHMIDEFECIKCKKCMEVCEENAVIETTKKLPKLPNRLTKVGKFKKHS